VKSTLILEEIQHPQPKELKEDMQAEVQETQTKKRNPTGSTIKNIELAMEGNGMTQNQGSEGKPDDS
jgi:hypothetical protein